MSSKQALNHYNRTLKPRAVNEKVLTNKSVTAQATTSMRSQITERQQQRWHGMVDSTLARLMSLNTNDGKGVSFTDVMDYFVVNLDEECITAQGGVVKIEGAASVKKHEKETGGRVSMTMMKSITAAGDVGPVTCLMAGQTKKRGFSNEDLVKMGAPVGSSVIMTPTAFMTDYAFDELAEDFAFGVRNLPKIRDHPKWYVLLTADRF